jgi:hypothetical protein
MSLGALYKSKHPLHTFVIGIATYKVLVHVTKLAEQQFRCLFWLV